MNFGDEKVAPLIDTLREIGREFHGRGWSLGTSSNYSTVLSRQPFRLLITASGKDKGRLSAQDFVIVDERGALLGGGETGSPSAETLLHVVAARRARIDAVLHTHSTWATCLSDRFHARGSLQIEGYEMLKGLQGIKTHEHIEKIKIFENTQEIARLADELHRLLESGDPTLRFGFLLRRHGLYTWGRDLPEARRHVEIFEFLFEVIGRTLLLRNVPL
jgi:methylthioribulose-1-phosphate dehydratase